VSRKRKRKSRWPAFEIVLLMLGILYVSPCVLAVINSLKPLPVIRENPFALPASLYLESYRFLFTEARLAGPMVNSLIMCVIVILSLITTAPMAAYSMMRRRMATGKLLRLFFVAGLTIPFQVIMVPLLKEFKTIGAVSVSAMDHVAPALGAEATSYQTAGQAFLAQLPVDFSYVALWVHYVSWGLPLCIFIYSGFMATIPKEMEESAALDGCGPVATFWRIVFPLLAPCTITVIIFWGLWIWNDFMQAFIVVGPRAQLVFVQLYTFLTDKYVKNWSNIFAGTVVLSMPVTILYLAMQRRFIKGLTAGALK
jgi:raffinose/stachyose/melibiose transport system permease protein